MKRWFQRLTGRAPCWHSAKDMYYHSFIWGGYFECSICGYHPNDEEL